MMDPRDLGILQAMGQGGNLGAPAMMPNMAQTGGMPGMMQVDPEDEWQRALSTLGGALKEAIPTNTIDLKGTFRLPGSELSYMDFAGGGHIFNDALDGMMGTTLKETDWRKVSASIEAANNMRTALQRTGSSAGGDAVLAIQKLREDIDNERKQRLEYIRMAYAPPPETPMIGFENMPEPLKQMAVQMAMQVAAQGGNPQQALAWIGRAMQIAQQQALVRHQDVLAKDKMQRGMYSALAEDSGIAIKEKGNLLQQMVHDEAIQSGKANPELTQAMKLWEKAMTSGKEGADTLALMDSAISAMRSVGGNTGRPDLIALADHWQGIREERKSAGFTRDDLARERTRNYRVQTDQLPELLGIKKEDLKLRQATTSGRLANINSLIKHRDAVEDIMKRANDIKVRGQNLMMQRGRESDQVRKQIAGERSAAVKDALRALSVSSGAYDRIITDLNKQVPRASAAIKDPSAFGLTEAQAKAQLKQIQDQIAQFEKIRQSEALDLAKTLNELGYGEEDDSYGPDVGFP